MKTFLEDCAEKIFEKHQTDVRKVAVVLPGKRAGRFFKRHYSNLAGQSIWSPSIFAFDQFLERVSDKKTLDATSLLFELFAGFQETFPQDPEPFERFSSWGTMALRDFNEIDNYLIPPKTIFRQITDIKEIEGWSLNDPDLTEEQQNFAAFWERLGKLYEVFTKRLEKLGTTSTGQVKRWCAENPDEWMPQLPFDHVWILGLNALTKAEKKIIYELEDRNLATCIWDADEYYADNKIQEAGIFFRELERDRRKIGKKYQLLKSGNREIRLIATASRIGQAKALNDILAENYSPEENTAIVLTDESLLLPVLSSLPQKTEKVNVTMGLPLEFTSLKVVFDSHLELLENRERDQSEKNRIYYRHFLKCLSQPGLKAILNQHENDLVSKLQAHIKKNNLIWIDTDKLSKAFPDFEVFLPLFDSPKNTSALIDQQRFLAAELKSVTEDSLHQEMIFRFSLLINKLEHYLTKYPFIHSTNGYRKLWNQLLKQENLSFVGEPLSGLQILGMLETRAVDFEHIVMLSANEDILPQSKFDHSFIPMDLKKYYGLPTYQQRDAIFAYYFYRLLQRAKKVDLLYSTTSDDIGSTERSRFLTQIEHELPDYNPGISIKEYFIHTPIKTLKPESKVRKTDDVLSVIDAYLARGVSPSAINNYLNCPLNFYYRYVMKLKEQDEVEEKIERSTFGTIVHEALEKLYMPLKGKVMTSKDIAGLIPLASGEVEKQFTTLYSSNTSQGENLLTLEVAKEYTNRFLKMDLQSLKTKESENTVVTLKHLELGLEAPLVLHDFDSSKEIRLFGKADRIDQHGGELRIIDYKTGSVKPADLKVKTIDDAIKKPKVMQLLFYCLAYCEMNSADPETLRPGMISLKNIGSGFIPLEIDKSSLVTAENLKEFKSVLAGIFDEIYDTQIPFEHNPNSRFCDYCE